MATELKTIVVESSDGSKFNIKDATTGWGDTYATANITAANLLISGSELDEDVSHDLAAGDITDFLSDDGLDVTADELDIGDYFSDGYYEIKLTLTLDVAPNSDYYVNKKGFLEEHKNRVLDMSESIEYPVQNYRSEHDKIIAALLMDSAQAAADRGSYTKFEYIVDKINAIFDNYNMEALW